MISLCDFLRCKNNNHCLACLDSCRVYLSHHSWMKSCSSSSTCRIPYPLLPKPAFGLACTRNIRRLLRCWNWGRLSLRQEAARAWLCECWLQLADWDAESPPKLPLLAHSNTYLICENYLVVHHCSDSVARTTALVCTFRACQKNLLQKPGKLDRKFMIPTVKLGWRAQRISA